MNKITDELYERFKTNLEKVDGRCVRSSAKDLGKTLAGLMKELDIPDTCLAETPLLEETGVKAALEERRLRGTVRHCRAGNPGTGT